VYAQRARHRCGLLTRFPPQAPCPPRAAARRLSRCGDCAFRLKANAHARPPRRRRAPTGMAACGTAPSPSTSSATPVQIISSAFGSLTRRTKRPHVPQRPPPRAHAGAGAHDAAHAQAHHGRAGASGQLRRPQRQVDYVQPLGHLHVQHVRFICSFILP